MNRWPLGILFWLVVFGVTMGGCHLPTESSGIASIIDESHLGGKVIRVGTPVRIAWKCVGCENVVSTEVSVYLCKHIESMTQQFCSDGGYGEPDDPIARGRLTDSFVWDTSKIPAGYRSGHYSGISSGESFFMRFSYNDARDIRSLATSGGHLNPFTLVGDGPGWIIPPTR